MDCPTCHHRNSPTANFCEHCGAPLAAVERDATTTPLTTAAVAQEEIAPMTATTPQVDPHVNVDQPLPPGSAPEATWSNDPADSATATDHGQSAPPIPPRTAASNWVDLRRPDPNAPEWAVSTHAAGPRPAAGDSRLWAIGAHASAIAGGFLGGIPAFVGPLIVWLARKNDDPFAAAHGRDALNFNLSVLLYGFVLVLFSIVTFGLGAILAVPIFLIFPIAWLVLSILGAVKAANDEPFRYPLTINFVR